MESNSAVPVIYYHSVADHDRARPWSFLSCDIESFKMQMEYLYENDYYTCSWDELYSHLQGEIKLPPKSVMIHFDDGFLDNWSVVFPIMKKYWLKFSIVVSPDFIDRREIVRPFVEETKEENIRDWWGYLSLKELQLMESSGLVDIQAHGYSHSWYPISDEIVDIYTQKEVVPWLYWNREPESKPYWLNRDLDEFIPLGTPIFKNEKSLANLKAFIPNREFVERATELYNPFLSKNENIENLNRLKERMGDIGRYETDEESTSRLTKELKGTKDFLEKHLNKKIEYLVWPGGGHSSYVEHLAFKFGYKLVSKGRALNRFNSKLKRIMRVAGSYEFDSSSIKPHLNRLFLMLQLERASGNEKIAKGVELIKTIKRGLR